MTALDEVEKHESFGGVQGVYRHASRTTAGTMTFAVFVPPQARHGATLPVLTYLSGLTCTHTNVMEKGEYRRIAAELGLIIVCPDTSPRGDQVPDDAAYDFGKGASFYLDADEAPWKTHFRMYSYVTSELPALIEAHFPADVARQGLFGHSMGGHGALTLALREPQLYRSVSAFSPIANPMQSPWGRKALAGYLGNNEKRWRQHDAVALIEDGRRVSDILVDVGTADPFLEAELMPDSLERACANGGIRLTLRRQPGYDHSYYFISSFMEDHLKWHAARL